jgi:hypothetical protein
MDELRAHHHTSSAVHQSSTSADPARAAQAISILGFSERLEHAFQDYARIHRRSRERYSAGQGPAVTDLAESASMRALIAELTRLTKALASSKQWQGRQSSYSFYQSVSCFPWDR